MCFVNVGKISQSTWVLLCWKMVPWRRCVSHNSFQERRARSCAEGLEMVSKRAIHLPFQSFLSLQETKAPRPSPASYLAFWSTKCTPQCMQSQIICPDFGKQCYILQIIPFILMRNSLFFFFLIKQERNSPSIIFLPLSHPEVRSFKRTRRVS